MANRNNTFILKRSNIAGKKPNAGDLLLGELAINTADVILYASGTTANSILPIGWDRIARTGDTMTGNLYAPSVSATTLSGTILTIYQPNDIVGVNVFNQNEAMIQVTRDSNNWGIFGISTGETYIYSNNNNSLNFYTNDINRISISSSGNIGISGSVLVNGSTIIQSGLTANTIYTDYIDFNTGATVTDKVGRLHWNDADEVGTLELDLKGGNVKLQIGEENLVRVYNDDTVTLTAGTVVYTFGSQGNTLSVKRASATGETTSSKTLGIVRETIAVGDRGFVSTGGLVHGLDMTSYSGGQALWLGTDPGSVTSSKPNAPYHNVLIGFVSRTTPSNNGSIFVHISNGWEIDELHDVRMNDKTFGDLLTLSAYNGYDVWVNSKTLNGSYTITGDTTVGGQLKASSISATTYYNLPIDIRVTGGTYDSGTSSITFTNNTGGTFSVTGFTGGGGEINTASNLGTGTGLFAQKVVADLQFKSLTSTGGTVTITNDSTTVNLEVVPASNFTGGTVNGETIFTNGLTANTISATTYYNLPTDVYVTGGTYSNGIAEFTNNTGGTFNVSGFKNDDLYVTGGTFSDGILTFTNNTGGTFNITTTTNYAAGPISGASGWSNNSGEMNLPAVKVALANNANNLEPNLVYDIASGTTGIGSINGLTNNDTNYIVIEYNGGSPRYQVYNNDGIVNDSSVVLIYVVYRLDTFIHVLEFGNYGAGLANKLNDRFMMTNRFGWESGLNISLSGSTGVITLSAGVAWNGPYRQTLVGVNSQDDRFFKNFHSGGTWTYTISGDTLNNTYYDNGTDIVTATTGKYLTNYYYRGQEINDHLYEVYSTNEYDSITEAEAATNPDLPELISSHAFLVGRIIVGVGATTGITQTAFGTVFQPTGYAPSGGYHNDLSGIQGGTGGQYYHLTSNEYNNNAYTNVDNNFSTTQTVNGNVKITGDVSGNTNSVSSDNLITVALLYLSNNT